MMLERVEEMLWSARTARIALEGDERPSVTDLAVAYVELQAIEQVLESLRNELIREASRGRREVPVVRHDPGADRET